MIKRFREVTALDDVNLEVQQGEMMGLIGPDGAGKTTLLRILCGLLIADQGECWIAERNVRDQLLQIRQLIGYMPQRFSLYSDLTVAENLRFFADLFQVSQDEREQRMKRLLEFSRLSPFIHRRAAALSGGMKQKLALSCTLIHTPKVLLLDEPTTGVDPVSRREFWEILTELRASGVTILLTTPYMDEAAKCDRVALIYHGKILMVSAPAQLAALLNKTVLDVVCDRPAKAAKILSRSGCFDSVHSLGDRVHLISGQTKSECQSILLNLLEPENIRIDSINEIAASIEDVFVQLLS